MNNKERTKNAFMFLLKMNETPFVFFVRTKKEFCSRYIPEKRMKYMERILINEFQALRSGLQISN